MYSYSPSLNCEYHLPESFLICCLTLQRKRLDTALLVCLSISLRISTSGIFFIDNVATILFMVALSACVNFDTFLYSHFRKINFLFLIARGRDRSTLIK